MAVLGASAAPSCASEEKRGKRFAKSRETRASEAPFPSNGGCWRFPGNPITVARLLQKAGCRWSSGQVRLPNFWECCFWELQLAYFCDLFLPCLF